MTFFFSPAPLLIYFTIPLIYSAKAVTAAMAIMAAASYDGFDHAAIFNINNVLITYRGQRCLMD